MAEDVQAVEVNDVCYLPQAIARGENCALILERDPPTFAAPLGAYQFARNPLYSVFMPRLGQVTGTPANGRMLLERGRKVMVFPEGEIGGGKTIFNGYKLMPFGKGFMRLAYTSGVPIVPFAFVGGEEMVPSFSRMEPLARKMGSKLSFKAGPTAFHGRVDKLEGQHTLRFSGKSPGQQAGPIARLQIPIASLSGVSASQVLFKYSGLKLDCSEADT